MDIDIDKLLSSLSPAEEDEILLRLLSGEGRYHYYPQTMQADGSLLGAHATWSDSEGTHSKCWACLLRMRVYRKRNTQ